MNKILYLGGVYNGKVMDDGGEAAIQVPVVPKDEDSPASVMYCRDEVSGTEVMLIDHNKLLTRDDIKDLYMSALKK